MPPPGGPLGYSSPAMSSTSNLLGPSHNLGPARHPSNDRFGKSSPDTSPRRPAPAPERLDIPTAPDVRFGIPGAVSPGWEDVRRRSTVVAGPPAGRRRSLFRNAQETRGQTGPVPPTSSPGDDDVGSGGGAFEWGMRERERQLHERSATGLGSSSNARAEFGDGNLRAMGSGRTEYSTIALPLPASPSASLYNSTPGHEASPPHSSLHSSPYSSPPSSGSQGRFDLLPDDVGLYADDREADDDLHDPGPPGPRKGADRLIMETAAVSGSATIFSLRGWLNALGLVILGFGLVTLFAGYPVVSYFVKKAPGNLGAFNIGGTNASGQVPDIGGFRGLIDKDTPQDVMTKKGLDGQEYTLVFSDEFNQDGRTFWKGDDPYWEAVDLHYWATNNLEWYDPDMITTANGSLVITLKQSDPAINHNLNYTGGMLQTWNKFCFTGGIIETRISLPGSPKVPGLWPAAWTMGNLGRAGYGATLDGTWPYSYDTCDIGTLANQTDPNTGGPIAVTTTGDSYRDGMLSYLPGQKLSACTCNGEDHPGPVRDGGYVGRSAPEIDIFEATVTGGKTHIGEVSQSAQLAPYDPHYALNNRTAGFVTVYNNPYQTVLNSYSGGVYQQAASGLSHTKQTAYDGADFSDYGVEYATSDTADPYITWTQDDQAMWSVKAGAMGPNAVTEIGQRLVSVEPMYILLNLGMSENFGHIDYANLALPAKMRVDWVRVYQPSGQDNIGCDPKGYPTSDYIEKHREAYSNPNMTTWAQYVGSTGHGFPKNRLTSAC